MKFLHLADLHLDSPLQTQATRNPAMGAHLRVASREVLRRAVDAAIERGVDAVLLAGDTFDAGVADIASRAALAAEIARLGRAGIPAFLIQGNHDALLDLDRFGPVSDSLTILTAEAPTAHVGNAAIHGIGLSGGRVPESLLPDYPEPVSGRINVGMMHSSLDGTVGHDPYAPCALADLMTHGYDYWALGHIHKRSEHRGERSLVVMPGIPQGRSIREVDGGSATLVTIDLDGVRAEPIPLASLVFDRLTIPLAGARSQAERDGLLRHALEAAIRPGIAVALRVEATGTAADLGDPVMLEEQARLAAEDLPDLYLDRVTLRLTEAPDTRQAPDALVRYMRADAGSPGFVDEAAADLEALRRALPAEARDSLDAEALETLIAEGIDRMALRLGGEGAAE